MQNSYQMAVDWIARNTEGERRWHCVRLLAFMYGKPVQQVAKSVGQVVLGASTASRDYKGYKAKEMV